MPTKIRYTRLERHIGKTYRRFAIFDNNKSKVIHQSLFVRVTLNDRYVDCWLSPNLPSLFVCLDSYCNSYKCDKEIRFISDDGMVNHTINLADLSAIMLMILSES